VTPHRRSYWKTVGAAAAALTGLGVVVAWLGAWAWTAGARWAGIAWAGWTFLLVTLMGLLGWAALVVAGGLVALHRDALEERGVPYPPAGRRERIAGRVVGAVLRTVSRAGRRLRGRPAALGLLPGEAVEVRPLEEILATLDEQGAFEGIPFMPEMVRHCGQRLRVLRRAEKIYDWVWHTGLRRLHDSVILEGLRCDGAGHGGCQAMCHLLWKEAWLRRAAFGADADRPAPQPRLTRDDLDRIAGGDQAGSYRCQLTELKRATAPLRWGDPRHYLRDLVWGNVRLRPFLTGIALRVFRWAQRKRGGVEFPIRSPAGLKITPDQALDLYPGELVRVKPKRAIERTLNQQSRNRGLFFDADMHRYCGGTYRVLSRVERVIEEQSGRLMVLSRPSIALEDVAATGEYLAFGPQSEFIFWREIWLERTEPKP
jgi:hypothetical protein